MDLHLDITRSSADFNDKLLCNLTDLFKMKTVGKEFRIFYKLRIECGILQHVSLNLIMQVYIVLGCFLSKQIFCFLKNSLFS